MVYIIIAMALLALVILTLSITYALSLRKLKKDFEDQIANERNCRHQLEEFYIQLHKDFAEHYYKYH